MVFWSTEEYCSALYTSSQKSSILTSLSSRDEKSVLYYLFILYLKLEVYIVYIKTKLIQSNYQKEKKYIYNIKKIKIVTNY